MKKYLIGILIGLAAGYIYSSCRASKWKADAANWKAEYEKQKVVVAESEAASNGRIAELLEKIGGLQGNIDSLVFANAGLEELLADKEHANGELQEEAELLKAEVQPVLDANPKVAALVSNLQEQIGNKDSIIFTLREQRENDQKIIFSLTQKYEGQVQISMEYMAQLKDTKGLLRTAELRLNLLEKRVAWLGIQGDWKTLGLVAAVTATVLSIVL